LFNQLNEYQNNKSNPMVTGTSVVGVVFDGGVVIGADLLGSYGSMAQLRNLPRVFKVNESTVIGGSGDYADFQFLHDVIKQKV
jgi:20S proteasome subunit beta 7